MSKKEPITKKIGKDTYYVGKVVPSGNSAKINFSKRFIGKNVLILIPKPKTRADIDKEIFEHTEPY